MTSTPQRKNLVLILARDLAEHLSTPVFLVDTEGTLIFFNEAAESILGQRFADAGELTPQEAVERWPLEDPGGGGLIPFDELPLTIALMQRRPAHRALRVAGSDGTRRDIEAVAFPLADGADDLVGAAAIFWERRADGSR